MAKKPRPEISNLVDDVLAAKRAPKRYPLTELEALLIDRHEEVGKLAEARAQDLYAKAKGIVDRFREQDTKVVNAILVGHGAAMLAPGQSFVIEHSEGAPTAIVVTTAAPTDGPAP